MTYLVISCDRTKNPPQVRLDASHAATSDLALQQIAGLRPNADIVMAATAEQLRNFADSIEKLSPLEINLLHAAVTGTPKA
jgi:hypothetical protein